MRGVLEALYQGDYDTAIERLTRKALFGRREEAKEALLLLAEVHSLYGEEGLEKAHRALEEAYELGELEYSPLYRALLGELLALEGRPEREVLPLFLPTEDPRARYHQAQALFYLGRFEEVLNTLRPGLPAFLAWRAEGLKGRALERLGRHREAALAYERGAELALGLERYWLLLDAAAMWLEAGEGERALMALEEAKAVVGEGEGAEDAATRHYLLARAHLLLGNPNRALEEARRALEEEEESGHKAYGTPLVAAQALSQLGRYQEAMEAYEEALRRAEAGERPYVLHEIGVAALDQGAYLEAEGYLREALREEAYPTGPRSGPTWRRPSTARGATGRRRRPQRRPWPWGPRPRGS
jgi:tetratricopeptide (TPR) repeat protein